MNPNEKHPRCSGKRCRVCKPKHRGTARVEWPSENQNICRGSHCDGRARVHWHRNGTGVNHA